MWILLSILSSIFWAVTNIIDKFIVTKKVKSPLTPLAVIGTGSLIFAIIISPFSIQTILTREIQFLALTSGAILIIASYFYFKAAQIEDISTLIPFYNTVPLFTAILSALFLQEIFTLPKYLGVLLLTSGSMLLVAEKNRLKFGKPFMLVIISSIILGFHNIVTKVVLSTADFWTIFTYNRLGAGLISLPLLLINRVEIKNLITAQGRKTTGLIIINESFNILAILTYTLALVTGFATLVSAFSSLQPFFVLGITILLTRFKPNILYENPDKKKLFKKIVAITLMCIGVILIV